MSKNTSTNSKSNSKSDYRRIIESHYNIGTKNFNLSPPDSTKSQAINVFNFNPDFGTNINPSSQSQNNTIDSNMDSYQDDVYYDQNEVNRSNEAIRTMLRSSMSKQEKARISKYILTGNYEIQNSYLNNYKDMYNNLENNGENFYISDYQNQHHLNDNSSEYLSYNSPSLPYSKKIDTIYNTKELINNKDIEFPIWKMNEKEKILLRHELPKNNFLQLITTSSNLFPSLSKNEKLNLKKKNANDIRYQSNINTMILKQSKSLNFLPSNQSNKQELNINDDKDNDGDEDSNNFTLFSTQPSIYDDMNDSVNDSHHENENLDLPVHYSRKNQNNSNRLNYKVASYYELNKLRKIEEAKRKKLEDKEAIRIAKEYERLSIEKKMEMRKRITEFRTAIKNHLLETKDPMIGEIMRTLDDSTIFYLMEKYQFDGYNLSPQSILALLTNSFSPQDFDVLLNKAILISNENNNTITLDFNNELSDDIVNQLIDINNINRYNEENPNDDTPLYSNYRSPLVPKTRTASLSSELGYSSLLTNYKAFGLHSPQKDEKGNILMESFPNLHQSRTVFNPTSRNGITEIQSENKTLASGFKMKNMRRPKSSSNNSDTNMFSHDYIEEEPLSVKFKKIVAKNGIKLTTSNGSKLNSPSRTDKSEPFFSDSFSQMSKFEPISQPVFTDILSPNISPQPSPKKEDYEKFEDTNIDSNLDEITSHLDSNNQLDKNDENNKKLPTTTNIPIIDMKLSTNDNENNTNNSNNNNSNNETKTLRPLGFEEGSTSFLKNRILFHGGTSSLLKFSNIKQIAEAEAIEAKKRIEQQYHKKTIGKNKIDEFLSDIRDLDETLNYTPPVPLGTKIKDVNNTSIFPHPIQFSTPSMKAKYSQEGGLGGSASGLMLWRPRELVTKDGRYRAGKYNLQNQLDFQIQLQHEGDQILNSEIKYLPKMTTEKAKMLKIVNDTTIKKKPFISST